MNTTYVVRLGLRLVGCTVVSVAVVVRLTVVLMVTLTSLMCGDDTATDVDRYCEGATDSIDMWEDTTIASDTPDTIGLVSVNWDTLTWNQLRSQAKTLGVTTLKNKRSVMEGLHLLGYATDPQLV